MLQEAGGLGLPLDREHLKKQTFGDPELEREIIGLFTQQLETLTKGIRSKSGAEQADLLHTLRGSARGIGAWALAHATQEAEQKARDGIPNGDEVKGLMLEVEQLSQYLSENF